MIMVIALDFDLFSVGYGVSKTDDVTRNQTEDGVIEISLYPAALTKNNNFILSTNYAEDSIAEDK